MHLKLKELKVQRAQLIEIAEVGLPAGLQSTVFSMSNVLIQSSINSFGTIVMAGNTVGSSLDGFVNVTTSAMGQSALSFTAQNMGAKQYHRVGKVALNCCVLAMVLSLAVGGLLILLGPTLAGGIYTDNPQVIEKAMLRLQVMCCSYFVCGMMDVMASTLRGMGHSLLPMVVTLIGACGLRILWIYTVFAWNRSLTTLYLSYPISWVLTFTAHLICFLTVYKKIKHKGDAPLEA